MKVLFFVNRYYPSIGGIERQSRLLSSALRAHGVFVTILTERHVSTLPSYAVIDGIPVHRVWSLWSLRQRLAPLLAMIKDPTAQANPTAGAALRSPRYRLRRFLLYRLPQYLFVLACVPKLLRLAKEHDIIQVFQPNLLAFIAVIAARLHRKRVIARDATCGGMSELDDFLLGASIASFVASHCDFVAISREVEADLLKRGVPADHIVRVPNAVELPSDPADDSGEENTVITVGNLKGDSLQKGFDVLILAWKRVTARMPQARLTIVGEGDFSAFADLTRSLGIAASVHFAGPQVDVGAWLRANAIFVLPSRQEGMSNALLEAMSFARPCVVTNVSGSNELIEDGVNGLKVPKESPESLAEAVIALLERPAFATLLGRNARESVAKSHQPDDIARQYVSLYRSLLHR